MVLPPNINSARQAHEHFKNEKQEVDKDNKSSFKANIQSHTDNKEKRLSKGLVVQTVFSEYKLDKQIGSGGNGKVFSAKDEEGNPFAIKFFDRSQSSTKLKRFKNEIYFCERHRHDNIVPVLDRGRINFNKEDYVFYVMPLYDKTLREKMKAGIFPEEAVAIFIGILKGLKYAHDNNTVHRDIKPENILFEKNSNEPVISDFGIAHFAEEDLLTIIETKQNDRMANFSYAAPEQYERGASVYPETDIYAAGLILNEMFTGVIPKAAGYKKIGDVNEEYAYLDEIFERIYKQNPKKRLYPETNIISEMKLLAEKYEKAREKELLQNIVDDLIEPEEVIVRIVDKKFKNGNFVFTFDRIIPENWYQLIAYSSYSHNEIIGYECSRLKKINDKELAMPLNRSENENTIKSIDNNFRSWVNITNSRYNSILKQNAVEEQKRKERKRKIEIEAIEKDEQIADIISKLREI